MPMDPLKDPQRWYNHLSHLAEKVETLSRLSPVCDTDEETAYALSILLETVHDYATQLHVTVQGMHVFMQGREGDTHE